LSYATAVDTRSKHSPVTVPGYCCEDGAGYTNLDALHHRCACRQMILKIVMVIHFGLQMREVILRHRVIPTHPGPSHRLGDLIARTPRLELPGGVLGGSSLRMKNCALRMKTHMITGP